MKVFVNYVFNLDEQEELKEYTPSQRFAVYLIKHKGQAYTYNRNDNIIQDSYSNKNLELSHLNDRQLLDSFKNNTMLVSMIDTHQSNDLSAICYAVLEELVKTTNNPIKKCQNCGMYFIPNSRLDEIYCDYPKANEAHVDKELEADMDLVLKVVVLGRACRNSGNMKNRQPLANMFVKAPFTLNEFFKDIIADELNIKAVTFTDDVRSFTTYTFKPQLRTVGPKYGKLLGKIRTALSSVDGNATMDELKANGSVTFDFDGEKVVLTEEDLLIDMTQKEGYVTESNQDVTVVLDCNLTPELLEEGFVREIISKIQTMRKEAGFEVTDHITVGYKDNAKIETIFSKYADEICADVLADKLTDSEISGYTKEWSINGETVVLTVSKE